MAYFGQRFLVVKQNHSSDDPCSAGHSCCTFTADSVSILAIIQSGEQFCTKYVEQRMSGNTEEGYSGGQSTIVMSTIFLNVSEMPFSFSPSLIPSSSVIFLGIIRLITQLVFCRQCFLLFSILPNPHSHLATSAFHGIFR